MTLWTWHGRRWPDCFAPEELLIKQSVVDKYFPSSVPADG